MRSPDPRPLSPFDPLLSGRYEVRLAGGASPGLRTDDLALAMAIAGAQFALGRPVEVDVRNESQPLR
jgi:hypothetical protein